MKRIVFKSLHRHALILGGERELVIFSASIAFAVAAGGMSLLTCVVAAAFWLSSLAILRAMAKQDPAMRHVFLRHLRQQPFYPARATPWARPWTRS